MQRLRKYLFDNEPVIGIEKAVDIQYIRILRVMLKILYSWPAREVGEHENMLYVKTMNVIYTAVIVSVIFMGYLYARNHFEELTYIDLGDLYITNAITVVTLSRILTLTWRKRYRVLSRKFFTEFHLFYYKDTTRYAMEMHKQIHKICHLFTLYLNTMMVTSVCLFALTPVYNNYAAGRFAPGGLNNSALELSVYWELPVDVTRDVTNYWLGSIFFIWPLSGLGCVWFTGCDLLLSIMVFHVWGHFKILINDLASFPVPTTTFIQIDEMTVQHQVYSEQETKTVTRMLKHCVIYHKKIFDFINEVSETFGPMLFVYYAYFQTAGCVYLLECSELTKEAVARYLLLTVAMFLLLIQVSCTIEMIGTISEKLPDAVYNLPWQHMDVGNRRTVVIFLMNVQTPVYVKAMGVLNIGVQTMATVLRTSFSYFMMLKSL